MWLKLKKIIYSVNKGLLFLSFKNNIWPSVEHLSVVEKLDYNLVIDIGANKGQFALLLLGLNKRTKIEAFEPVSIAVEKLKVLSKKFSNFSFSQLIVHENPIPQKVFITESSDNSSLLLATKNQIEFSKGKAKYKNFELIDSIKLSKVIERYKNSKILIKVDVQGTELSVLKSAENKLKFVDYIIIECSHKHLYKGQNLWVEIDEYLQKSGFSLFKKYNEQYLNDAFVQADYLYSRKAQ